MNKFGYPLVVGVNDRKVGTQSRAGGEQALNGVALLVEFFVVIILMVHPLTPQLTIGLSPNIAVPTRTTFAPSAIAKGKSPDIPIERMP